MKFNGIVLLYFTHKLQKLKIFLNPISYNSQFQLLSYLFLALTLLIYCCFLPNPTSASNHETSACVLKAIVVL